MNNDIQYGNYVIASGHCLNHFIRPYINELFTTRQIVNHMSTNVNRLLISYGNGLSGTSKLKSRKKSISSLLDSVIKCDFLSNSLIVIDSGGFQVCMGYVKPKMIPDYMESYVEFINERHNDFSMCFSLDLPISHGSIFSSYEEMESYNRMTYEKFSCFPKHIKDKIYYIHHYSSPSVYDIWLKFLNHSNYAHEYTNFSSPSLCGISSYYSIPLSDIVNHCKKHDIPNINFHALGCASPMDIFIYQLLTKHIYVNHGIKVNITYDSSSIFTGFAVGRNIQLFKRDGMLYQCDVRSNVINKKFDCEKTLYDSIYDSINEMCNIYGFKHIDPNEYPFYDMETGKTNIKLYPLVMLNQLMIYRRCEKMCEEVVDEIYNSYFQNDIMTFMEMSSKFLSKFYGGRVTKKINEYCSTLPLTMKILEKYDLNHNMYIVSKNNSDFSNMNKDIITL